MNNYLFCGKIKDTNEWISGGMVTMEDRYLIVKSETYDDNTCSMIAVEVEPETIDCFIVPFDQDVNNVYDINKMLDNISEKQFKKKPALINGRMRCPSCKSNQGSLHHYCNNCGQAIDWDEE